MRETSLVFLGLATGWMGRHAALRCVFSEHAKLRDHHKTKGLPIPFSINNMKNFQQGISALLTKSMVFIFA
jgi:hypothetical protein